MHSNCKTLVVYHYIEAVEEYKANLEFFLECGILNGVDYIILSSGECSFDISHHKNMRLIITDNFGSDLAAYASCIDEIYRYVHDFVIFLNCTMLGPFLLNPEQRWTDTFTNLLTYRTKLAGVTINILPLAGGSSELFHHKYGGDPPFSHVQSMLLAMDHECLDYLIEKEFFSRYSTERHSAIANYEIYLSRLILDKGWNITCIMPEYQNLDYREITQDINPTSRCGDPWFENAYFGRSLHPYETVFFKINRGVRSKPELQSLMQTQKVLHKLR